MEIEALIDYRLNSGTAEGQMLYWNGTLWVPSDESKLKWDVGANTLTANTLAVTTGTITGAGGETIKIGVPDTVFSFVVDGATPARFQLGNDNGLIGVLALVSAANVVQVVPAANADVHFFALAASGENPELIISGFKTGDATKQGSLKIDTSGNLDISAELGVNISAGSVVNITDINSLTWSAGSTLIQDPGGITLVPSGDGIFTVTGDVDVSGSVTAAEYHGGSAVNLRETIINLGPNDSATISIVAGDTWTFNTDNVLITQLALRSETIILDAEKNAGTPTINVFADLNEFMFKENSRDWLSASWGDGLTNRLITLCEDVFHEQVALPIKVKDKFDGFFVEIDSFAGTFDVKGTATFNPEDGGNWPGAKVIIGEPTNHSEFEGDGTLVFKGTATVFNDIVVDLSAAKVPAANAPTWSNFIGNLKAYTYGLNDLQEFGSEIAHSYKEGSNIEFHVHGATNGLEGVDKTLKFEIEYELANNQTSGVFGDAYAGTTTINAEITIPANTADKTAWIISLGSDITGSFLQGSSLVSRVRRIASTGTEPAADPFVVQIGIHIEEDTVGSRTLSTK